VARHRAHRLWRRRAAASWALTRRDSDGGVGAAGGQGGEVVDELQRREGQCGAPIALGLGQAVDDLMPVDLLEPFQGEGRASTITQQLFQSRPIMAGNAYRSVKDDHPHAGAHPHRCWP